MQRSRIPWCGAGAQSQPACPWHLTLFRTAQVMTSTVSALAQSPWLLISPSRTRQSWTQLQGLLMATPGHIWPSTAQLGAPSLTSPQEKEAAVPLTKASGIQTQDAKVMVLRDEVISARGTGGQQGSGAKPAGPAAWLLAFLSSQARQIGQGGNSGAFFILFVLKQCPANTAEC